MVEIRSDTEEVEVRDQELAKKRSTIRTFEGKRWLIDRGGEGVPV